MRSHEGSARGEPGAEQAVRYDELYGHMPLRPAAPHEGEGHTLQYRRTVRRKPRFRDGGGKCGSMTAKDQLRQVVEAMSDEQAAVLLDAMRRQFGERLAEVPLDDEIETDEERDAMEEARADLAAGRLVHWTELRRRYQ